MITKFRAKMRLNLPSEGGRYTNAQSGFRPQLKLGGLTTSCTVVSANADNSFILGNTYEVVIHPMFPEHLQSYLETLTHGDEVILAEGSKIIAVGSVIF